MPYSLQSEIRPMFYNASEMAEWLYAHNLAQHLTTYQLGIAAAHFIAYFGVPIACKKLSSLFSQPGNGGGGANVNVSGVGGNPTPPPGWVQWVANGIWSTATSPVFIINAVPELMNFHVYWNHTSTQAARGTLDSWLRPIVKQFGLADKDVEKARLISGSSFSPRNALEWLQNSVDTTGMPKNYWTYTLDGIAKTGESFGDLYRTWTTQRFSDITHVKPGEHPIAYAEGKQVAENIACVMDKECFANAFSRNASWLWDQCSSTASQAADYLWDTAKNNSEATAIGLGLTGAGIVAYGYRNYRNGASGLKSLATGLVGATVMAAGAAMAMTDTTPATTQRSSWWLF